MGIQTAGEHIMKVGIVGATGYTGLELVRLLKAHPHVEIAWLTSETYAGQRLSDVSPCPYDDVLVPWDDVTLTGEEVVFLCLPHAASMDAVRRAYEAGCHVIDLSADFRLPDPATYERWYGVTHRATDLLPQAVYGLPEVYRERVRGARLVANPGCYPTSVNLALYPLARAGLLEPHIIVDSKSGVSGAGRKPKLTTHFVEANENLSPYNVGYRHRHIAEMERVLGEAWQGAGEPEITFSPHLLPVNRGILSTIYVTLKEELSGEALHSVYEAAYTDEPFVRVLPLGQVATLRHTQYTNLCVIGLTHVRGRQWIITSSIDNLLKGASGQAVQNMNLMLGYDETTGLRGA